MKITLGPLDRRKLRTRCVACTRRKIKCEGGTPCVYCVKKGWGCVPQAGEMKSGVVFVNISTSSTNTDQKILSYRRYDGAAGICSNVPQDQSSLFVKHFYSAFLATNDFGETLDLHTIVSHFQSSPSLYHALIAVGALDLSKGRLLRSVSEVKSARIGALTAYRTSVLDFQRDISSKGIQQSNATLWTTFFLGLFELMFDDTGEGFVKHFLYGTSRILQLRGPEAHLSGPGKSFFLTVRVFEICRSLIYSEPTLLDQVDWRSLMEKIYEDSREFSHPKEVLFDLMIECTGLSHRVWDLLKPDSDSSAATFSARLSDLAHEGISLRSDLRQWNTNFSHWSHSTSTPITSPQSLLAAIYFHATSIYLSGIFDYRPQFHHIASLSLPQDDIQHHVDSILSLTQEALKITNLGGVLFFFPLRVAGARVTSRSEADTILQMFKEISKRSFAVAEAFVVDLKELWEGRGI